MKANLVEILRKNLGCIIVWYRTVNIHQKQLITWKKNVHLDVKNSEMFCFALFCLLRQDLTL